MQGPFPWALSSPAREGTRFSAASARFGAIQCFQHQLTSKNMYKMQLLRCPMTITIFWNCWSLFQLLSFLSVRPNWDSPTPLTRRRVCTHCKDTVPKIRNKYSQKRNCMASVQILHSCACEQFYIPMIGLPIL
jgi:hypothetical protein